MFLARGETIEVIDTYTRTLREVLRIYIAKRFSGRVTYKDIGRGIELAIELLEGDPVACRGVDERGNIVEGSECLDKLAEHLDSREGIVEVLSIPSTLIEVDLREFPSATVEPSRARERIEVEVPRPPEKPVEVEERVEVRAVEKPREIELLCMDPILLFNVLKRSQFIYQKSGGIGIEEVMEILDRIDREHRPRYIYVRADVSETSYVRILFETETRRAYIEFIQDGTVVCGEEAFSSASRQVFSTLKVWVIS